MPSPAIFSQIVASFGRALYGGIKLTLRHSNYSVKRAWEGNLVAFYSVRGRKLPLPHLYLLE